MWNGSFGKNRILQNFRKQMIKVIHKIILKRERRSIVYSLNGKERKCTLSLCCLVFFLAQDDHHLQDSGFDVCACPSWLQWRGSTRFCTNLLWASVCLHSVLQDYLNAAWGLTSWNKMHSFLSVMLHLMASIVSMPSRSHKILSFSTKKKKKNSFWLVKNYIAIIPYSVTPQCLFVLSPDNSVLWFPHHLECILLPSCFFFFFFLVNLSNFHKTVNKLKLLHLSLKKTCRIKDFMYYMCIYLYTRI